MTVTFDLEAVDGDGALVASVGAPITAPALIPSPVNLVRSSRIPADDTGGRWVNGIAFTPEGIGKLEVDDACSPNSQELLHVNPFVSDWQPYVLAATYTCSAFGYQENDYVDRAKRLLDAATPKLLEWEFWGGPLSQAASLSNRYLTGFSGTVFSAAKVAEAFGILENALGDCGYGERGMIHVAPLAIPYCGTFLRREGNLLLTQRDTIVVPGAGYARYSADATLGGKASIDLYATGITDVRLGEIIVDGDAGILLDRTSNTVSIKARRYALVSWDELCEFKVTLTARA